MKKKLLGLLFAVCMLVTGAAVFEARAEEEVHYSAVVTHVNPRYADVLSEEELSENEAADKELTETAPVYFDSGKMEYQKSVADAAAVVRQQMEQRKTSFSIGLVSEEPIEDVARYLYEEATAHTGVPTQGDYLACHCFMQGYIQTTDSTDGVYRYAISYSMKNYTTAEQEAELEAAVRNLLQELNLWDKNEYDKIFGIYDYLCKNIVFKDTLKPTVGGENTAYGALINGTANGRGFASLFYRLVLTLGVDARIITGDTGGSHAWNIVKAGDLYYNLDAAWDAGAEEYGYFLSGWEFWGHVRDEKFETVQFHAEYPMDKENYADKGIEINEENFPDEVFRKIILENYDLGKDGVLKTEQVSVTNIDVYRAGISDLTGIELFTNLTRLNCSYNNLRSLDVSACTGLEELYCSYNHLTVLNVSACTKLKELSCGGNHLTALDVSACTGLETFSAGGNTYDICVYATFNLSKLPGFDITKVSDLGGAFYDASTNSLRNISGNVTYTYDCGGGFHEEFFLIGKSHIDENGDGICERCERRPGEGEEEVTDSIAAFVNRIYRTMLEREPDANSRDWINKLRAGTYNGTQIIEEFYGSEEFTEKNRNLSDEDFVQLLYRTLFDREADQTGLAEWTGRLRQGYLRKYVLAGIANSQEFRTLSGSFGIVTGVIRLTHAECTPGLSETEFDVWQFVERLYVEALGRTPDEAGLKDWVSRLLSGEKTGAQVAEGFLMSQEFLNKSMTEERFVRTLYRVFFDRDADAGGLADWLREYSEGRSKRFIFAGFINSGEFQAVCDRYGITRGELTLSMTDRMPHGTEQKRLVWEFVERLYNGVLGRPADETGLTDWGERLFSGEWTGTEVANGFLMSPEFLGKDMTEEEFLKIMYRAFFGREADETGLRNWLNAMQSGTTKEKVIVAFAGSDEFRVLCERAGIEQGSVTGPEMIPERPNSISNGTGSVTVAWKAIEGAKQYGVWRSETGADGEYRWLGTFGSTEYTDTAVENGATYHYRLTVYDSVSQMHSGMSEAIDIIYVETPEITAIYNDVKGITLEWNAVECATGYLIYREFEADSGAYWNVIQTLEGNETLTWTDTSRLEHGEDYRYAVCAMVGEDKKNRSDYGSNGRSVRWMAPPRVIVYPILGVDLVRVEWRMPTIFLSGCEVRLLLDSAEYGIYDVKGFEGYIGQDGFGVKEFEFLEDLEGEITVQVRSYTTPDSQGKIYSAWTEPMKAIRASELNAQVDRLVEELTASAETDVDKAIAIYEWLVCNTSYKHDYYRVAREVESGECVFLYGQVAWGGYARAFEILARKAGLEAICVKGKSKNSVYQYWNQVKIDGKWYWLDSVNGDCVGSPKPQNPEEYLGIYNHFLLSDEAFIEKHKNYSFDSARVHECPEDYDVFECVIRREWGDNFVIGSNLEELRSKIEQNIREGVDFFSVWYVNKDKWISTEEYWKMVREIAKASEEIVCYSDAREILQVRTMLKAEVAVLDYENIEGKNTLVIPDGMTSIGGNALARMEDLEKVVLPDSITSIGSQAFWGCTNLKEIHIPDSVTLIMDYAFKECSSLVRIDIPKGVSRIMNWTFAGCSSLEEVKLHDGVMQIDFAAFMDCSSLKSIQIPEGVIYLDECVFLGCSSLTEIHIPESVTEIDRGAFLGCNEKLTLYCPAGSYAETFAIENGLAYVTE